MLTNTLGQRSSSHSAPHILTIYIWRNRLTIHKYFRTDMLAVPPQVVILTNFHQQLLEQLILCEISWYETKASSLILNGNSPNPILTLVYDEYSKRWDFLRGEVSTNWGRTGPGQHRGRLKTHSRNIFNHFTLKKIPQIFKNIKASENTHSRNLFNHFTYL